MTFLDLLKGVLRGLALTATFALAACSFTTEVTPPPRADDPIQIPDGHSELTADVAIELSQLRRALEKALPKQLWSIDKKQAQCVHSKKVDVIGIKIKTPTIRCDLNGKVTRGKVSLTGRGQDLIVTMPIQATVKASDIAGIIKSETANAKANVQAKVRLSVARDWAVSGKVDIHYDWTQPPAVKLLGQEITFADKADQRLKRVVGKLERTLEREIARLDVRSRIEPVWERGFAVLSLNRENPPVWLRLTPESLRFDGYSATRNALNVQLQLQADTRVIVGEKPAAPNAVPLPDMPAETATKRPVELTLPVVADYAQLEPVIERALRKRAERPFALPALGERMIELNSVTLYGTTGQRIAAGIEFEAWKPGDEADRASGTVWLTARPINAPNSRAISFTDVEFDAATSRFSTNILLEIAKTQDFSAVIEGAMAQNFESDFQNLMSKIDGAVARRQVGNFTVETDIAEVSTGQLVAFGEGLFLPVAAGGATTIKYTPKEKN